MPQPPGCCAKCLNQGQRRPEASLRREEGVTFVIRVYRTEINPTPDQAQRILRTMGVCRHLYNLYVATNQARHAEGLPFESGYAFSRWINTVYVENHPWVRSAYGKARKQAIMQAEAAFKRFFAGRSQFPRFKRKHQQDMGFYFVKNNPTDCRVERHRIKIPTLGWVRLKEKGYLPKNTAVLSGTITQRADRFYVSVRVQVPDALRAPNPRSPGMGIDLGVKTLATVSDGRQFPNINKTPTVVQLERRLRRAQRRLARMSRGSRNRIKHVLKIQRLYARLSDIRDDYRKQVIAELVKPKPAFVVIEDLNVAGMTRNRHLAKAVRDNGFGGFRRHLTAVCTRLGIELRVASRWYPSSRQCARCGTIKSDLTLADRVYTCTACGWATDRDWNAAMNLQKASEYQIVS